MEYERLEINNIASIEHAVIDFSSGLLAEEPLFLICGETGAGKSTILDAICLALFKKTPRMSERSGQNGEITDGNVWVSFFDTRQMMRKNTAEAYVRLDFVGSDKSRYTAEWSVARARRKVSGALQPEKWALADHTAGVTYVKVRDIERVIGDAVGLTFEQFCRTSMLAQGEFTRFLKSPDKDKAAILEKLTGTGFFSEVGKTIFRITKEKSEACEAQRRKLDGIQVMDEAALAEKKAELERAKTLSSSLKNQRADEERKMQWLRRSHELQVELQTKSTVLEGAQKTAASEETQEARKNAEDWKLTAPVRQNILNIREFEKTLKKCETKETECLNTFLQLKAEESVLIGEKQNLDGRLLRAGAYFNSVAEQEPMLKEGKALADALDEALASEREADKAVVARKEYEKKAEDLRKIFDDRKNEHDKRKREYEEVEKRYKSEQKRLDAMGVEKVHEESERLETLGKNARTAKDGLATLVEKENDLAKERERVRQAQVDLAKDLRLKSEAEKKYLTEKNNCDEALKIYERQSEMVSDMAKELRSRLVDGECCPVCGQTVVHVFSDEQFESLLQPFRKEKEAAEKKYRDAKDVFDTLTASVGSKGKGLKAMQEDLKQHSSQCEISRSAVYKQVLGCIRDWQDWQSQSGRQGDETGSESTAVGGMYAGVSSDAVSAEAMPASALQETLEAVVKEIEAVEKIVKEKKNAIEECRRVIGRINVELTEAQKTCSSALEAMTDADKKLDEMCKQAESQKTIAQNHSMAAAKKLESVSPLILIQDWRQVWVAAPESLIKDIREESEKYAKAVELRESLEKSRESLSALIGTFTQMTESVCGNFPQWQQATTEMLVNIGETGLLQDSSSDVGQQQNPLSAAGQVSETFRRRWTECLTRKGSHDFRLEEWKPFFEPRWTDLLSKAVSVSTEKFSAAQGIASERSKEDAFYQSHQDMSRERVEWLMSNLTDDSADALTEKLNRIDAALEKAKTECAQVENSIRTHGESRPEIQDRDTVEALEERIMDLDVRKAEADKNIGAIGSILALNEQNLLLREKDETLLRSLEKEYHRWETLNGMFGSADGSRFRGIAQAFILKQLLMCANRYLQCFSPRYELDCQPGSVGIVIRDLYQGDAVRPYSTLSGGEGFIVSLALALGLSAMTRGNASVDVLFIDEGFGTLSEDYLNTVIDTLSRLHETGGRKVGIISHVDILRERIPAQIRLLRENNTASRVEVVRL